MKTLSLSAIKVHILPTLAVQEWACLLKHADEAALQFFLMSNVIWIQLRLIQQHCICWCLQTAESADSVQLTLVKTILTMDSCVS